MSRLLRRFISTALGALSMVLIAMPMGVQASDSNVDAVTAAHIARAIAKAPPGVTNWKITVSKMTLSDFSGSVGRTGAGVLTNTVYGNCGSAWMAMGNQGAGRAWISLGWNIYYGAYWENWSTAVAPRGSSGGGGPVPPWSSTSWDTGYSAFEGNWVYAAGSAWMAAYLYQGGACTSNGPVAAAWITP